MNTFPGWELPTENWSKLPHAFISLLPYMTAAEMKVTLYLLRHTWGYGNFDEPLAITLDEFMYGRAGKNGGRLDEGTGLARQSVLNGLNAAEERGTMISFRDDGDLARAKKLYGLKFRPQRSKNYTPISIKKDLKESNSSSKEDLLRQQPLLEEEKTEEEGQKKKRKLSQKQIFLKDLQEHFQQETGLPAPPLDNDKQRRAANSLWWEHLWEMYGWYGKGGYDEVALQDTKDLISSAVAEMRENKLTISTPKSIKAVAASLFAEGNVNTSTADDFWSKHI